MKILVIGGMHGNEPLGIALVEKLKQRPIKGVDAVAANQEAIKLKQRFDKQDLNRSFPGDTKSPNYEPRRAATLVGLCRDYDLVFDFHNTHCPDNDCTFVGEAALPELFDLAEMVGLDRVIVADYDCLNKYAPNCISVEISLGSQRNDVELWYEQIRQLAREGISKPKRSKLQKYRFVYRMTLEDKERLDLDKAKLQAFVPIDEKLAAAIGVRSPAYPIFIADKYTPYNYGGVLNEINV